MELINYEYIETDSRDDIPMGEGWDYWGMRITSTEKKAVWRRHELLN